MNNNLIYFICDDFYKDVLEFNISKCIKNSNINFDICIICPIGFKLNREINKNIFFFEQNEFDYKFTAKFNICNWDQIKNYKNILYLDVDAIVNSSIEGIFETINSDKNIIHGVKEVTNINDRINDVFFRFTKSIFDNKAIGYNCGTFGFNKKMLKTIKELLNFCELHKKEAFCDQPIYNEFIIKRNLISNTLSNFVYLYGDESYYNKINKIKKEKASIIHFIGGAYSGKNLNLIKSKIKQIK